MQVESVEGNCPVYNRGDSFRIDEGYKLNTDITLCMHSLSSIFPYYVALSKGVSAEKLGLSQDGNAHVQCLDPCEYTGGGTVVFEIMREKIDESI